MKRCKYHRFSQRWIILIQLFIMFIITKSSFSQTEILQNQLPEKKIQETLERLAEQKDGEYDDAEFWDELNKLRLNPVALNDTNRRELRRILFLNDLQIENLISYIREYGLILTIFELDAIPGFDEETIRAILPFIVLNRVKGMFDFSLDKFPGRLRSELFIGYQRTLEKAEGYQPASDSLLQTKPNSRYLGSPDKVQLRYTLQSSSGVELGLIAEKDAGEQFFKGKQKYGFDFYSGYLSIEGKGVLKKVILGDYRVRYGQGLVMWNGLALGKSADAVTIKKSASGLRPSRSSDENGYLRGIAIEAEKGIIQTSFFASSVLRDANLELPDTSTTAEAQILSLLETGLHRTPDENKNRKVISENSFGGNINLTFCHFKVGTTVYTSSFSGSLNNNDSPEYYFALKSNRQYFWGADYVWVLPKAELFGELAIGRNDGKAFFTGINWMPVSDISLSALYRNYNRCFLNPNASALSESSNRNDEEGFYAGIRLTPLRRFTFAAYADWFSFSWLKYRIDAPSKGVEYSVKMSYLVNTTLSFQIIYRNQQKALNTTFVTENTHQLFPAERQNLQIQADYSLFYGLNLRSRAEWVRYRHITEDASDGFLIFQDLIYHFSKGNWDISCRYALFNSGSYDSRVYAYETDVPYAYALPAMYDEGSRFYVRLHKEISRNLEFWIRYSVTTYTYKTTISSGTETIDGNQKSDIHIGVKASF